MSFRDLVRTLFAERKPKELVIEILSLLDKVYSNAAEGESKDIKFSNPRIKKLVVDEPSVLDFVLRFTPFTRLHKVEENLNEMVLRLIPNQIGSCVKFAFEIKDLLEEAKSDNKWWNGALVISIKVLLPDGRELLGNFTEQEKLNDIKEWIGRQYNGEVLVAASWDPKLTFSEDSALIKEFDLHRKRLIIKLPGDLGQKKMEEVEEKRKAEQLASIRQKDEKFQQKQLEKSIKKETEVKNHQLNIQRFQEDRKEAMERSNRIIKKGHTKSVELKEFHKRTSEEGKGTNS